MRSAALALLFTTACVTLNPVTVSREQADPEFAAGVAAGRADAEKPFAAHYYCLGLALSPPAAVMLAVGCKTGSGADNCLDNTVTFADTRPYVPTERAAR